jgi:prolyl-tRNA synthetase
MNTATKMHDELCEAGIEVLLDDRDQRAGFKFKDADLIGIPIRVTIGNRFKENGEVEIKIRSENKTHFTRLENITTEIKNLINSLK